MSRNGVEWLSARPKMRTSITHTRCMHGMCGESASFQQLDILERRAASGERG